MSEPTPREIERKLAAIEEFCREVREDYRWSYPWSRARSRSGEGGKTTKGTVNDETGNVAFARDKVHARAAMRHTANMIDHAFADLRSAAGVMRKAMGDKEPEVRPLEPAFVSRAELAESRAAKQRREAEGRGWGEA